MGCEGIASNLSQGLAHKIMNTHLNFKDSANQYANRGPIRDALTDPSRSYVDILEYDLKIPEWLVYYVADHWYNPDPTSPLTWWKEKQPIEPIVRQGLIAAIDLAEELPIVTYWAPIGNRLVHPNNYQTGTYRPDDYPFEILLARSETQLTHILLTPPSPQMLNPQLMDQPANIWVVNRANDIWPKGDTTVTDHIWPRADVRTVDRIATTHTHEYSDDFTPQADHLQPYTEG